MKVLKKLSSSIWGKCVAAFLVLSVTIIQTGCYSYSAGALVRTDPIEGTRKVDSSSYQVVIVRWPSLEKPTVVFKVEKKEVYRTEGIQEFEEMKRKNDNASDGLLSVAIGAVSLPIGLALVKSNEPHPQTGKVNAGQAIGVILAAAGGIFLIVGIPYSFAKADPSEPAIATGRLVHGGKTTIMSSGAWEPAPRERISVSDIDEKESSKQYVTDSLGEFSVNLPLDLGLTSFDYTTTIPLQVKSDVLNLERVFSLNTSNWTTTYLRITQGNTFAHKQWTFQSSAVTKLPTGSEYRVLKVVDSWTEIKVAGENCWVPPGSGDVFWATPTHLNPRELPHLTATVQFEEPSGNNILDANETGSLVLKIKNSGSGTAYRVSSNITPDHINNLSYDGQQYLGDIQPGATKTQTIPISADMNIENGGDSLTFKFNEANGFEPPPIKLVFTTGKFLPPHLKIADVGIEDANGNGMIDPGELVKVTARVENDGEGVATDVRANITVGENIFLTQDSQTSFDLDTLRPGQEKDIQFSIVPNMRATSVPVYVDLSEHYGKYGEKGIRLPLALNKRMNSLQEIVVNPKQTNTAATPVLGSLTPEIETDIPTAQSKDPNAFALVIGISNYSNPGVPSVLYAKRDAAIVREYLIKALGYDPQNILPRDPDELMTIGTMRTYLKHIMPSYLKPDGSSDVFIYYTGHGAPRLKDQEPFLVPYDCDPNFVNKDNAYDLKEFYTDISNLNARHKIVVVDACFSGVAGNGVSLLHNVSAGMLMLKNPIYADSKTVIFQSSKSDQVSNWYPEEKHSMFTYFFLKGLHGGADKNGDGIITANELMNYIDNPDSGLPYYSNRLFQRPQDAQLTGNRNMVIEDIKK